MFFCGDYAVSMRFFGQKWLKKRMDTAQSLFPPTALAKNRNPWRSATF
jgi:hypothetical protein